MRDDVRAHVVSRESVSGAAAALRDMVAGARPVERRAPDWLVEYRRDRLALRVARVLEAAVDRGVAFEPCLVS
jgi:hypothetical protein